VPEKGRPVQPRRARWRSVPATAVVQEGHPQWTAPNRRPVTWVLMHQVHRLRQVTAVGPPVLLRREHAPTEQKVTHNSNDRSGWKG
jgi:hypothetical protein